MSDNSTINYSFALVEVGGSYNSWGDKLNANFESIDEILEGKLDREGGTLTGPLLIAAGTEATPSIGIAGDDDTGFYSSGAGNISVTCNGAQVLSCDPGGVTVDKLLFKSQINGYVATVQHLSIRAYQTDADNGGLDIYTRGGASMSFRVRVTEDGRVGIGTSSPVAKLDVEGNWAFKSQDLASGSAIDCRLAGLYYKTITGNTTFTITNVPASRMTGFVLELTNAGAFTITWPAAVKWPLGVAPTLTASGLDVLTFYTRDSGVTWRGQLSQKGSA